MNRIGHPDWVKLSVELNCAPNQNTKFPFHYIVMSYFVVLFLNLPFQKVFSNILLILLPPLSSLVSITSCIGRLMVWRWGQVWVPRWQIFFVGFCESNLFNKIDRPPPPCIIVMLTTLSAYLDVRKMQTFFSHY